MKETTVDPPRFVMWRGEPREVEKDADDDYYWLKPEGRRDERQ